MWPFKSSARLVKDFRASRDPQAVRVFIAKCDIPADVKLTELALHVRAAVAELGQINPEYIYAEDRFDRELIRLPFWGSLDTIGVVLALEEHLGIPISESEAQQIMHPELDKVGVTVADFVKSVLEVLATRDDV